MFEFIRKLFKKKTLSKISFLNSLEKSFLNGKKENKRKRYEAKAEKENRLKKILEKL